MTGEDAVAGGAGENSGSAAEAVDKATLQRELHDIKGAMGIEERHPGLVRIWLLFGLLVLLASLASQYVLLERLPGYWFGAIWFGLMGLGGAGSWWLGRRADDAPAPPSETTPDPWLQFGVAYVAAVAVQVVVAPFLGDLDYVAAATFPFAVWVAMAGVGYVLLGNALKAHRVRRRDRMAFSLGGAWMVPLAVVISHVEVARTWGYAVFGVTFFLHAIGAYLVLSRR
jgi:hypothetical protein